jgi:hypothetical protein
MNEWGLEVLIELAQKVVELAGATGQDWLDARRREISEEEQIAARLSGQELRKQRRRIAALKRNVTLGQAGLARAGKKAALTRWRAQQERNDRRRRLIDEAEDVARGLTPAELNTHPHHNPKPREWLLRHRRSRSSMASRRTALLSSSRAPSVGGRPTRMRNTSGSTLKLQTASTLGGYLHACDAQGLCTQLQFQCSFQVNAAQKAKAEPYNRNWIFGKVYSWKDSEIILDHPVQVSGGVTPTFMRHNMELFENMINAFVTSIGWP